VIAISVSTSRAGFQSWIAALFQLSPSPGSSGEVNMVPDRIEIFHGIAMIATFLQAIPGHTTCGAP
jgi:hypothetical protein